MMNVKKKEQINRPIPIIPARYLSIILILIFVVLGTIAAAEQTNKLEARDSWREIKLILNAYGAVWCDNRHIAFSGDNFGKSNKGIRIYDLDSGMVQDITNDPGDENVSCAADGQYIVFTDKIFGKKQSSLFVYDRSTKTIKKMYEMESILLKQIDEMPLSPHANYLLGPDLPEGQKYILPGGKEVKLVPYRRGISSIPEFSKFQWSFDESRLFLFDPNCGKVTIHSLEDNGDRQLSFGCNLRVMYITKDNKLYVDIMFGSEIGDNSVTNLYIFDLNNPAKKRKLVSDIEWYDADDEGNIVFSKGSKNERFICYLKRGSQQPQILKEIPVPRDIGIWPRIAKDGKAVFYSIPIAPRGAREYTILIKN
jgi:hypothetical protein